MKGLIIKYKTINFHIFLSTNNHINIAFFFVCIKISCINSLFIEKVLK